MPLQGVALTLKTGGMHAILREIRLFIISTPKGWRRIRRHSRNPVNSLQSDVAGANYELDPALSTLGMTM